MIVQCYLCEKAFCTTCEVFRINDENEYLCIPCYKGEIEEHERQHPKNTWKEPK